MKNTALERPDRIFCCPGLILAVILYIWLIYLEKREKKIKQQKLRQLVSIVL